MKKTFFALLTIIAFGSLIYWFAASNKISSSLSPQNDTLFIKQCINSAKKQLQNKPDSAILLYTKAIKKLESFPLDKNKQTLLANTYIDLSCVYVPQCKYDVAKKLRYKALKIADEHDLDIQARILMEDGLTCYYQSNYKEALNLYERVRTLALKTNNVQLLTNLRSNIAIIRYSQGDVELATTDFKRALQLAEKSKDPALISDAYINLGKVYMDQMDYERSKACYASAIDYYKKNGQNDDLMVCYRNLGNVFYMMEKYTEAIDLYKKSLKLAIELDNKKGIAKGYHNVGEIYMNIGDYVQAKSVFIKSLKIKESIGDRASMAKGYRSLGNLHFLQKNFRESLFYHQKSLQINTDLQLIKDQAKDNANLSTVYAELNQLPKAIVYCSKALNLAQQIGDTYGVAEDTRTLGGLYFQKKDYILAEFYYKKAISQKLTLFDQEGLAMTYRQMAELYLYKAVPAHMNNLRIALSYALKAWDIAEKQKMPQLITEVSKNLSDIYKKLGNYPKAYHYLVINRTTTDSTFNKSKTEALTFAEARWNNEKKQQQIANLEKLNTAISAKEYAEAKRHKVILLSIILLFVLAVISAGFYWLYREKQREIIHQKQLSRNSMLRLQNIRNRISPHFIFNILNREISSRDEKSNYQEMFGLVTFLRRSLEITEKTSVSLEDELDFVKNYLQMELQSFDDNFRVVWEIEKSIDTKLLFIPAMIMQIPIENALKHALRPKNGDKQLNISITRHENAVRIVIQDNGDGYHPEQIVGTKGTGTGLKVLYQTIQLLNEKNSEKILFQISDVKNEAFSGTKVEITIPCVYNYEW